MSVVNVSAFLATLRDRDIQVWAEGEQLRCNAPMGTLTSQLREELRQYKAEIMAFLHSAASLARQQRAIVPLQPRGSRPPAFAFGGHNGDVFCFRALARHLGEDQPLFGLQPPGLDGTLEPLTRVEELAAYLAQEIRTFHPVGPYAIVGFCAGGTIAFELSRQLVQGGAELNVVALFGAPFATAYRRLPRLRKRLAAKIEGLLKHARAVASLPCGEKGRYILQKLRARQSKPAGARAAALDPVRLQRARVERATLTALRLYRPARFAGLLSLFLPCKEWARSCEQPLRWRTVAQGTEEYFGPPGCSTDNMLLEPFAPTFAGLFRKCRGGLDRNSGPAVPVSWGSVTCEPV